MSTDTDKIKAWTKACSPSTGPEKTELNKTEQFSVTAVVLQKNNTENTVVLPLRHQQIKKFNFENCTPWGACHCPGGFYYFPSILLLDIGAKVTIFWVDLRPRREESRKLPGRELAWECTQSTGSECILSSHASCLVMVVAFQLPWIYES